MTRWKVIAYGTPCGGTVYTTEVLLHRGFRVGHEREGLEGVSCGFAVWSRPRSEDFNARAPITPDNHPGYRPRCIPEARPEHVVWTIRHPLRTAETLPYYLLTLSEIAYAAHPPELWVDDPQLRALRYWVLTHERIRQQDPDHILRVGPRYDQDAKRMLAAMHRATSLPERLRNAHKEEHRWPRMAWRDWERADPSYAERARVVMEAAGMTDEDMDKRQSPMEKLGWV